MEDRTGPRTPCTAHAGGFRSQPYETADVRGPAAQPPPPPIVLFVGPEELLVRRSADELLDELRAAGGGALDVVDVAAADIQEQGGLPDLRTASLFGTPRAVVVRDAQDLPAAAAAALVAELEAGTNEAAVLLLATGTGRIPTLARRLKAAGARRDVLPSSEWQDRRCAELVDAELRRLGRAADAAAVAVLLDHAGLDVTAIAEKLGRPPPCPPTVEDLPRGHDLSDELQAVLLGTRIASASWTGQVSQDDDSVLEGLLGAAPPVTRGWLNKVLAMTALVQRYAEPMSAAVEATLAAPPLNDAADETVERQLDGLAWLAEVEPGDRGGAAERHGLSIAQERRRILRSVMLAALLARHSRTTGNTSWAAEYSDTAEPAADTDSGQGSDVDATLNCDEKSLDALSRREEEIAMLISEGCTNQRIARALSISQKTVETHLGRIFRKLMVSSRAEVAFVVGRSVGR